MSARDPAAEPADWSWGGCSDTGATRSENQDRMGVVPFAGGQALVLCDGMGGHRDGGVAAELALRTFEKYLACIRPGEPAETVLRESFAAANEIVHAEGRDGDPAMPPMGSTAVVCVTRERAALVGHVGDSRAYLCRRRSLQPLTRDHTRVQRMVDAGMLTLEQARVHPEGDVLSRCLGILPEVEADLSAWIPLRAGDAILLCSDGLSAYVENEEMLAVLQQEGSPQELSERLVRLALRAGSEDNVTVQIVRYDGSAGSRARRLRKRLDTLFQSGVPSNRTGSEPS